MLDAQRSNMELESLELSLFVYLCLNLSFFSTHKVMDNRIVNVWFPPKEYYQNKHHKGAYRPCQINLHSYTFFTHISLPYDNALVRAQAIQWLLNCLLCNERTPKTSLIRFD